MNTASITRVKLKNFRPFKDIEMGFNSAHGLKYLGGENRVEPRLGANGSGKSSFWDGVSWCFYGVSVKGAKTSSVQSWKCDEKVEAEVTLDLSGQIFNIRRYGPPQKIEINGLPAEQKDVDELLGLSRLRFLHAIIFGQGVPLFPDLSIPERGELFDEVLNLGIWSKCSDAATARHRVLEQELSNKKVMLSFIEGKLAALKTDEQMQIEIGNWEATRQAELEAAIFNADSWEQTHAEYIRQADLRIAEDADRKSRKIAELQAKREEWKKEQLAECEKKTSELESLESRLQGLQQEVTSLRLLLTPDTDKVIDKLKRKLRDDEIKLADKQGTLRLIQRDLEVYETATALWQKSTCPTCEQPISEDKRKEKEQFFGLKKESMQLEQKALIAAISELGAAIEQQKPTLEKIKDDFARSDEKQKSTITSATTVRRDIERLEKEVNATLTSISDGTDTCSQLIKNLEVEKCSYIYEKEKLVAEKNPHLPSIEALKKQTNPYTIELSLLQSNRQQFIAESTKASDACKQAEGSMLAADYWKQGFKRIRLYFVQQIINALEVEIQSALSALGLQGWAVKLSTETETKSGTMKLGIQIKIKSPTAESTWDSWSGGESQRLRLAVAMGLSSLIQRAAGVWFNIEVWDEPTNWLGAEGIEDLLEALKYRAESQKKSVWVIDHRALTYSGFKEIWTVCKEALGSKIYLVSEAEM